MREFHGEAEGIAAAPQESCFNLVAAVDRYPDWCPDIVSAVEVLERLSDDQPRRVRMRINVRRAGIAREFGLFLAIAAEPPLNVKLTRFTDHPTNQEFTAIWTLSAAAGMRIALVLDAKLRLPSAVPARGIPGAIAEGFVSAACRALSAAPQ